MTKETVLITGAAGGIGLILRSRLAKADRILRLLDIAELGDVRPGEEHVYASITDPAAMDQACRGVTRIVHLAGISTEASWNEIAEVNIKGTHNVFEGARKNSVSNFVFASSNHAVGFFRKAFEIAPDYELPLPDTNYGVSKATGEAMASMYTSRYSINTVSIRILSCFEKPRDVRHLSTWLSPDDAGRLFEAALHAKGQHIVWGVSANTRSWFALNAASQLGYEPQDNAEVFAEGLLAEHGELASDSLEQTYLGGRFCGADYDADRFN